MCSVIVSRMMGDDEEMQGQSQEAQTQRGQDKASKTVKFPCLRCKKNVAKNSRSVRCHICQHWVHVECEGMPIEMYNLMANPEKYGAVGLSWTCMSCQSSMAKIQEVVGRYENRIKEVRPGSPAARQWSPIWQRKWTKLVRTFEYAMTK